jgi:hypothetical protein
MGHFSDKLFWGVGSNGQLKPIRLQFFETYYHHETDALSPLVIFRHWTVGII